MKHGLPFHLAFGVPAEEFGDYELTEDERTAFAIAFGVMDGGEFDWQRGRWKERK